MKYENNNENNTLYYTINGKTKIELFLGEQEQGIIYN